NGKGSPAEELIKSYPPGGNSYEKALKQLKMRFGKSAVMSSSCRETIDSVESSLPEETLVAWQRYRSAHRRIREVNLDDSDESKTIIEKSDLECILEFLQAEVEAEERIFLASQSFNNIETKSRIRIVDDRFEVDLPWLEYHPPLTDYFDLAERRLNKTVKRLKIESNYEAYGDVFKEWLEEGVIEEADKNYQGQVLYLPHREVIKKIALQNSDRYLMLRPKKKIGVIADIRRAFLQISVSPTDRDFLRFLWLDSDGQLKVYRHCRVVFGVASSPFLLNSTIQLHLQTVLEKIETGESLYTKGVIQKLMHSFYVDNCVSCVKNEEELNHFISVSTEVMAERKFELRGWEFNDINADASADTNVLGLIWNKKSDTLRINTGSIKELCFEKVTKRLILSTAHRLFDPLGMYCPVILIPKLLLQETWKQKITWDEEVDTCTRTTFLKWLKDIDYLEKIHFPRYFGSRSTSENTSVHIFCDASKHAYAVAAFIRIKTLDSTKVQLIQARTWITREEAWNVFVQNRVKEIRRLTNKDSWRHIPGCMNPADLPSRGCSALSLLKSQWWLGPIWLYLPEEDLPKGD
ncbi:uncharacterized protein LOC118205468, partial [Stegodyphus dumicola]|uniref:uncharacterized protein LOC118205468 n=1 Tax=Stegodyphus dumicola TaxID=202533 RepID=UPI0015AE0344